MWWLWGWLAFAEPVATEVPAETIVYYNARMALREGAPMEAARLWLLRNAMADQSGNVSAFDGDFQSVTWAALGEMGVCQDGQDKDTEGAGLWPLAVHNWVVKNRNRRGKANGQRPFRAFALGQQARKIAMDDVLSYDELTSARLKRGFCLRPRWIVISSGEKVMAKLSDRAVSARTLKRLLEQAKVTLQRDRVRGLAAIEARLFDIELQLTNLAAKDAKRATRRKARAGKDIGLSPEAVERMRARDPRYVFPSDSRAAAILRASVTWSAEDWMSLSPERRRFVYENARAYLEDGPELDATALRVLDAIIEQGDGAEVEKWIALYSEGTTGDPATIWMGERGEMLLSMDDDAGFDERGVIALHRGVHQLQQGDMDASLRSLAYALQVAPESARSTEVAGLALRWLSYVASQFAITDELLITLKELVPRREYGILLEDLMWGASFRADDVSFQRGLRHQVGRGALERRMGWMQPMAEGDLGAFLTEVRDRLEVSPSETTRFLEQLIQRLEREDRDTRVRHRRTLAELLNLLDPLTEETGSGRQGRRATEIAIRMQAVLEGVGGVPDPTLREDARMLDPDGEVFAGSVRLAPSDALPWPFKVAPATAPSVYSPLDLTPVEWVDEGGEWVLGWQVSG